MAAKLDSAKSNGAYVLGGAASGDITVHQVVNPAATDLYAVAGVLWTGEVAVNSVPFTLSFGGTSMPLLDEVAWRSNKDRLMLFGVENPPTGESDVTCHFSGASTELVTRNLMLVTATYAGVEDVSAASHNSGSATTSNTITLTGTKAAQRAVAIHGVGKLNGFTGAYNQNKRAFAPVFLGGALMLGDAPAPGATAMTATHLGSTANWGACGLILNPAVVDGGGVTLRTPQPRIVASGSTYRVTYPAPDRYWEIPEDPLISQEDL